MRVVSTDAVPRELSAFRVTGSAADPSALATKITERLRSSLGLAVPPANELSRAAHPLPAAAESARDYVDGLAQLEAFAPSRARESLERVVAAEPSFAPAHQALGEALAAMGRQADAARESAVAAKEAASLPNEERLVAEGDAAAAASAWDQAVDTYRAIVRVFPDRTDVALKLVQLLVRTGRARDARAAIDALVATEPRVAHDPRVEVARAKVDSTLGEHAAAVEIASRVRAQAAAAGLRNIETDAADTECDALTYATDLERMTRTCAEDLALDEKVGNRAAIVANLANTAYSASLRGQFDDAKRALDRALAIADEGQNHHLHAIALITRANITKRQGDLAATLVDARAALLDADAGGNAHDRASARIMLAGTLLDSGVIEEAGRYYDEALTICRASGEDGAKAIILQNLGTFWMMKGDIARAAASAREALAIQEGMGDELDLPFSLDEVGEIETAAGEPAKARDHFEASIALRTKLQLPITASVEDLAKALIDTGDLAGALREARAAADAADATRSLSLQVEVRYPLALALLANDKPREALAAIDRAIELARTSGTGIEDFRPFRVRALFLLGRSKEAHAAAQPLPTEPLAQREMRLIVDEMAIREGKREGAVFDLQALASEAHAAGHGRMERLANAVIAKSADGAMK